MQYSIRTEQAYVDWCQRFLAFCGDTPAERLGELLGYADVSTTMIYTHALNRPGVVPVRSLVDAW